MDFHAKSSMGWHMTDTDDEIDPIKVRTALFALVTARIEDAHEVAIGGQSPQTTSDHIVEAVADLQSIGQEIEILLMAASAVILASLAEV